MVSHGPGLEKEERRVWGATATRAGGEGTREEEITKLIKELKSRNKKLLQGQINEAAILGGLRWPQKMCCGRGLTA